MPSSLWIDQIRFRHIFHYLVFEHKIILN